MPAPQLDPLTHTYLLDGYKLDAVTYVIGKVLRQAENPWWTLEHRIRGTYVHRITEAIDEKNWDPRLVEFPDRPTLSDEVKEGIIQRGHAYQKFLDESGFHCEQQELTVWDVGLRLAGRVDKIGMFARGRYAGDRAIVDIKSGEPTPAAYPQVTLYEHLLRESHPEIAEQIKHRVILWLRPDGTCRPEYRNLQNEGKFDLVEALAIYRTYRFMERHGMFQ